MDPALVTQVRRFNRVVTQRVGALDDRFLARDRPLGEARVLWEISEHGTDASALRARLDLDSGYLSRMLRALETAGLVTVEPKPSDRRARVVRLTAAGLTERAELDRRSDDLASALLAPLPDRQRARLVAAMAEVERYLTAAMVELVVIDPAHPDAVACVARYRDELARRFEGGFDPAQSISVSHAELRPPHGCFVVAYLRGEPIGCGGLKHPADSPAELKRMWVADAARGLGVGRRLLEMFEQRARDHGARVIRLETNGNLVEAITMYRSAGYGEVGAFNDEPYAHVWFEKRL